MLTSVSLGCSALNGKFRSTQLEMPGAPARRRLDAGAGHGGAGAPARSGRGARAHLARGGGGDRKRRRAAPVLLGLRAAEEIARLSLRSGNISRVGEAA